MKMKVNYINSSNNQANNENTVKALLNNLNNNNKIDDIINNDISTQQKSFKERMEVKKKKALLSTSDLTEQLEFVVFTIYTLINLPSIEK